MRFNLVISILVATFITGCTLNKKLETGTKYEKISRIAEDCVTELSKKAMGMDGKYVFTFAFYVHKQSAPVINGIYTKSEKTGIPYFIATSLDNGDPGSAWRNCMSYHDALVAQIEFPKT